MAIVLGLFPAPSLSNDIIARLAGGSRRDPSGWGCRPWRWMFLDGSLFPSLAFLIGVFAHSRSRRAFLVASGRRKRRAGASSPTSAATPEKAGGPGRAEHAGRPAAAASPICWCRAPAASPPVVLVGMGLAAFQQLVGINIIFYLRRGAVEGSGRHRAVGPLRIKPAHRPGEHPRDDFRRSCWSTRAGRKAAAAGGFRRHGSDPRESWRWCSPRRASDRAGSRCSPTLARRHRPWSPRTST